MNDTWVTSALSKYTTIIFKAFSSVKSFLFVWILKMAAARRLQSLSNPSCRLASPVSALWTGARDLQSRYYESSAIGPTRFDQTKESNDPSNDLKPQYKSQAKQADSDKSEDHPAKQPDPQPSPSKSTGVRREGPGSKAGEGEDKGVTKDHGVLPSTGV
ncbi:hypothetical protein GGS21DRAFT_507253 [Xylaria nigripes]|nr:hypothetical protein GGS21DRAFT_507253 [Xylaria nigripes]